MAAVFYRRQLLHNTYHVISIKRDKNEVSYLWWRIFQMRLDISLRKTVSQCIKNHISSHEKLIVACTRADEYKYLELEYKKRKRAKYIYEKVHILRGLAWTWRLSYWSQRTFIVVSLITGQYLRNWGTILFISLLIAFHHHTYTGQLVGCCRSSEAYF